MRISVIIPSRLAPNPNDDGQTLWVERAIMSVRSQSLWQDPNYQYEIVLGLDPGIPAPPPLADIITANASPDDRGFSGQAHAMNAAVRAATGDVIAILEDDDYWQSLWIDRAVPYLSEFDLVTGNQVMVDVAGRFIRIYDFPTPSAWLMPRTLWFELGGMDETFRYHVDTDFLGRVTQSGRRRAHLLDNRADRRTDLEWLARIGKHSRLFMTDQPVPLVARTLNPGGGLWLVETDPQAKAQSDQEHAIMKARYGSLPW